MEPFSFLQMEEGTTTAEPMLDTVLITKDDVMIILVRCRMKYIFEVPVKVLVKVSLVSGYWPGVQRPNSVKGQYSSV